VVSQIRLAAVERFAARRGVRSSPPKATGSSRLVIGTYAKNSLHNDLRWIREALLSKLDGLCAEDFPFQWEGPGTVAVPGPSH
jgi:hypothetical protein